MTAWAALDAELDRWRAAGLVATFWWRDDDAVAATPALERLCALRRRVDVPLALAAIPAAADRTLVAALAGESGITVLPHGFAHRNHADPGRPKSEFGPDRDAAAAKADIAAGRSRLARMFAGRTAAVFVPPWNRIAPALVPALPGLGFVGLTTGKPRPCREAAPGLIQVNVHVDPIAWRGHRGFRGDAGVVADAVRHLAARRSGAADRDEPTGLMTHHLVHDDATWGFVERLIARTLERGPARWLAVSEAFETAP
jgi:peptidoglycan/xylan/chitin deacetylase (PgdA/CDA1 family)